jgi:hypothetical protein
MLRIALSGAGNVINSQNVTRNFFTPAITHLTAPSWRGKFIPKKW